MWTSSTKARCQQKIPQHRYLKLCHRAWRYQYSSHTWLITSIPMDNLSIPLVHSKYDIVKPILSSNQVINHSKRYGLVQEGYTSTLLPPLIITLEPISVQAAFKSLDNIQTYRHKYNKILSRRAVKQQCVSILSILYLWQILPCIVD